MTPEPTSGLFLERHAKSRILVVDDEPFVADIISRILRGEGYDTAIANGAGDALRILERDTFALMISDINMPGISGLELLSRTQSLYPKMAVLMATAVDDRSTAVRTLEAGAYGYLIKPVDENELLINVVNALERRRLTHHLEEEVLERTLDIRRREEEIALRLVTASEWRDNETGAHIRRIGMYSAAMAQRLGWDARLVDDIRLAACMHDVGKIGISDTILLKPGKLTEDEYEVMKTHTTIGAAMLSGSEIPILSSAREIALSHHEKWDGTGYPHRIAGERIPEAARIVAVADVYDALVNRRVYKPAMSDEEAIEIIKRDSDRHFDPRIVACFLTVADEFRRIRANVQEQAPTYVDVIPKALQQQISLEQAS